MNVANTAVSLSPSKARNGTVNIKAVMAESDDMRKIQRDKHPYGKEHQAG